MTYILKKFVNEGKAARHANLLYQHFDDDSGINSSNRISKYQIWIRNGIIIPRQFTLEISSFLFTVIMTKIFVLQSV